MFTKGDFHMHSIYSDGSLSPKEIVDFAKSRGVDIIALTDHNNTAGVHEAILHGKKVGITVIPAVELSTKFNNYRVHILGYFKDDSYNNELLKIALSYVKNHKTIKLKDLFGDFFSIDEIKPNLTPTGGIKLLKFFGATVVLAHPVLLSHDIFDTVIQMGFNGLEAKYYQNTSEDTINFLKVAHDTGMLYTAGSDFHKFETWYRTHGLIGDIYLDENEILDFLTKGDLLYHLK